MLPQPAPFLSGVFISQCMCVHLCVCQMAVWWVVLNWHNCKVCYHLLVVLAKQTQLLSVILTFFLFFLSGPPLSVIMLNRTAVIECITQVFSEKIASYLYLSNNLFGDGVVNHVHLFLFNHHLLSPLSRVEQNFRFHFLIRLLSVSRQLTLSSLEASQTSQ